LSLLLHLRFIFKLAHGEREEPHDSAFIDESELFVFENVFFGAGHAFDCAGVGVDAH